MSDKRPNPLIDLPSDGPLFVAGTDTGVGKTYVAARMLRMFRDQGRRVAAYKPVASGCHTDSSGALVSEDAIDLWEAAGRPEQLERVCPQRFALPIAPPAAAAAMGGAVDPDLMIEGARWWLNRYETVVIEGAGGLMSPLADECFNADLALRLNAPIVVVAANRLGTINQTLQTLLAARAYGLRVLGVILNQTSPVADASASSNAAALSHYASVPLLATVPYGGCLE